MNRTTRPAATGRRRIVGIWIAAALVAGALGAAPVALASDVDFGTVSVGGSAVTQREVPLVTRLSEMDPATVLYAGGNGTIDFVLGTMSLSVPLTAGALYVRIGEVTATYHLTLAMAVGTHFGVSAPGCLTGVDACTAELTFEPVAPGSHADAVTASVSNLRITGNSLYADLLNFLAPALESSIEGSALIAVAGIGVPASGTVAAVVDIAASAACVELSTNTVSFGGLSLGDEERSASPLVTVTNCSGTEETLYASGTDATGTGAAWALTDARVTCGAGLDLDTYRLRIASGSFEPELDLSTSAKSVQGLDAAQSVDHELRIFTACPGSTGAGKTMTMFVNYLVVGG
jgi:hypothetical protein